jgi:NAD(P)-dependent dehydrogenase (short-subunit alcohol dehydrogenase family)
MLVADRHLTDPQIGILQQPSGQAWPLPGDVGEPATAAKIVEAALSRFKSIDVLVNNAGIFFTKPFTDYTAEDFKSLVSTNLKSCVGSTCCRYGVEDAVGFAIRVEMRYGRAGLCVPGVAGYLHRK